MLWFSDIMGRFVEFFYALLLKTNRRASRPPGKIVEEFYYFKKCVIVFRLLSWLSRAVSHVRGRVWGGTHGDRAETRQQDSPGPALIIGGKHLTLSRAGRWWVEAGSKEGGRFTSIVQGARTPHRDNSIGKRQRKTRAGKKKRNFPFQRRLTGKEIKIARLWN